MDVDAFVCDRCKQQITGRPVGYWTSVPFLVDSVGGRISLEFCGACTGDVQEAIGQAPRLPRPDQRSLLRRLFGAPP